MVPATGLVLHFTRCNAPARSAEWADWLRDEHVPVLSELGCVRAATHFALTQQPTPGMPSVGFSHVTLFEITGDVEQGAHSVGTLHQQRQSANELHPNHCLMNVDILKAHGRWGSKSFPTQDLSGHIMAYVMCNDPRVEPEWDAWNDATHMPDMLASDGFTGLSRWKRLIPGRPSGPIDAGPRFLTLYDVGSIGVEEAVRRSAAIMPGLVEAGRKHPSHVGGLTVTLTRN